MIPQPTQWRLGAALLLTAALAGCASPGLPREPSLALPAPLTALQAARTSATVTLSFTAPTKTTDKLPIRGILSAALCRQQSAGDCRELLRRHVQPGKDIVFTDALPPALTSGPPVLLTYRVTLFNSKNRTAGDSNPAYVAGGEVPASVSDLTAASAPNGALLRWQSQPGTDVVELERRRQPRPNAPAASPASTSNPLATPKEPVVADLRAGDRDAGGTVDAAAKFGESYTYVAWRVRRLTLAGHVVVVRSAPSPMVSVTMRDIFPPAIPRGLTAVPANSGIDLSWEPDTEPDLAGYFVYRATVGSSSQPVRLNSTPVAAPAYHDASAQAGAQYRYSISAVDDSGNESARSPAVDLGIQ